MKYTLIIFLFTYSVCATSCIDERATKNTQTKIYLISPKKNNEDYQVVNLKDTALIAFDHQGDMGVWYGHFYHLKKEIPNGEYDIFIDNKIRLKAFMKNKMKDSVWIEYFENGNIQAISSYKNDLENGEYKRYYDSGKLSSIGSYVNGLSEGEFVEYYESGKLGSKRKYVNGKPMDTSFVYYESGKIRSLSYFKNGVHYREEIFDENGKLETIYDPINGIYLDE